MDNLLLMIVLAILFFLIGAGIAGYLAYGRGQAAGTDREQKRQESIRMGAEQEAARILAEAEAQAKQLQLSIKEEEVQRRKEMDAEAARRRTELEKIEEEIRRGMRELGGMLR